MTFYDDTRNEGQLLERFPSKFSQQLPLGRLPDTNLEPSSVASTDLPLRFDADANGPTTKGDKGCVVDCRPRCPLLELLDSVVKSWVVISFWVDKHCVVHSGSGGVRYAVFRCNACCHAKDECVSSEHHRRRRHACIPWRKAN